jgi:glycosyltransferase involved in cell wall biosynthesis
MGIQELATIIIPTYNRETKLPDAIESALNQTYTNTQIIIIDDGSTDKTVDIIKRYPQVEYYYQSNKGQASARNLGLSYARGTFIASLDSDDIWSKDFLSNCIEKLEADQLDFVFANWSQQSRVGNHWDFLINDPFLKPYIYKEKDKWIDLTYSEVRDLYLKSCPSPSSSVVLRKSSIVSGWDEEMKIGDDWGMYLEMIITKECKVAFTLEKLWRKRIDDINIFDGRKWNEVLEFLYIADLRRNIEKLQPYLSVDEMMILKKRYMASLVELSKHNLIREYDLTSSFKLLKTSFKINIPYTLKTIPIIFFNGLNRKINDIKRRI